MHAQAVWASSFQDWRPARQPHSVTQGGVADG